MNVRYRQTKLRARRTFRKWEKRLLHHPRLLLIAASVSIIGFGLILAVALRDSTGAIYNRLDDANIVVLHADDVTRILPTRENTVGEFLDGAGIVLNDGDIVEPAADTPIEEDDFRVNIYRAAPVVIQDGQKRTLAFSAGATSRAIVRQAGVDVYPEDELLTEPSRDFLRDGIGSKVSIRRATPVTLNLYGTSLSTRSLAPTIGELLSEKGVALAPDDNVKPSLETPVTDGLQIFVTRFGVEVISVEEGIDFPVENVDDPSLSYGSSAIRQHGVPGKKSVTYQVNKQNGIETSRTIIQEVVVTQPVKQIVARGTAGRFENFTSDGIPARVFCGSPRQNNWKNINVDNARIGRDMASAKGWTGAQFSALLELWACESSWNHLAGNPSSGAYGIPQSWPADKMGNTSRCGGPDYRTNPSTQISWGLCYIQSGSRNFHSPIEALNYHYRNNHY